MVVFSFPEERKYHGRVIYYFRCPLEFSYVGYASDFKARVDKHRSASRARKDGDFKSKSIWNKAIRRIGWDNLRVKILEYVPEGVCLKTRERWWIAKLKTQDPNGYNSNPGGGGPTKHTQETRAKISASSMGIGTKPVTSREIKEQFANGTQLVEFVLYASAAEAERQTKVDSSHITKCCLEKRKSAGGCFWHFTEEGDLVGEHRVDNIIVKPHLLALAVFSTSPGGKKQRHEGGHAAKRTLSKATGKKFSQSAISACCRGDRKSHHGYTFCYASDEEAENKKNTKKRKLTF